MLVRAQIKSQTTSHTFTEFSSRRMPSLQKRMHFRSIRSQCKSQLPYGRCLQCAILDLHKKLPISIERLFVSPITLINEAVQTIEVSYMSNRISSGGMV
jgi:hypothetical protein